MKHSKICRERSGRTNHLPPTEMQARNQGVGNQAIGPPQNFQKRV